MDARPRSAPKQTQILRDSSIDALVQKQIDSSGALWARMLLFVALVCAPIALLELALRVDVPARTSAPLAACHVSHDNRLATISVAQCLAQCPTMGTVIALDIDDGELVWRSQLRLLCVVCEIVACVCALVPYVLAVVRARRCMRMLPFGIHVHLDFWQHATWIATWFAAGIGALLIACAVKLRARVVLVSAVHTSASMHTSMCTPLVGDAWFAASGDPLAAPALTLHTLASTVSTGLLALFAYGLVLWSVFERSANPFFELPLSRLTTLALEKLGLVVRYRIEHADIVAVMHKVSVARTELALKSIPQARRVRALIGRLDASTHAYETDDDDDDDESDDDRDRDSEVSALVRQHRQQRRAHKAVAHTWRTIVGAPRACVARVGGALNRWFGDYCTAVSVWLHWRCSPAFWALGVDDQVLIQILKPLYDLVK